MTDPTHRARLQMRALLVAACVLVFGASGLTPASASSDLVYFTDADRTVACQIEIPDDHAGNLRCDLVGGGVPVPLPPRPSDCPVEWASVVLMDAGGPGLPQWGACVGDSIASGQALATGAVVEAGDYRCDILAQGVNCVNPDTGYGFVLSPTTYQISRPPAKSVLSPTGIGKLKVGMTKRQGRRTGYLGRAVCGSPQLKGRLDLNAYLSWRKKRLKSVLANMHTNLQTTSGVGIGSTLGEAQAAYPTGTVVATTDHVFDRVAHVLIVRAKRRKLVLLLQTVEGHQPSATTPVDGVWVAWRWNPAKGYGFSGC